MACKISELIRPEWIEANLGGSTKTEVLCELSRFFERLSVGISAEDLMHKLAEREQKASTGADQGLAIPHATIPSAPSLMVALGRSVHGVDFGSLDNERSRFFFTIVSPCRPLLPGEPSYLQAISSICRLMRSPSLRERILRAESAQEIYRALVEEEQSRIRELEQKVGA
jgi:mannitol/fructose-specific phosphotransferase system IIA component (Ntr-type)